MPTYLATLSAFTHFLTAYTHTLLYLRDLYPRASFLRTRFHNTPVYQSRHPDVCTWILDALSAVRTELLNGTVSRIAIVVFHPGSGTATGSVKVLERYMLDVSAFPVVSRGERYVDMEWADDDDDDDDEGGGVKNDNDKGKGKQKEKPRGLDADVDVDLSEQFRAALVTLTTRVGRLAPLPEGCSFNISMELKDEVGVDAPLGHPQHWIPVQPSLQHTGRKGAGRLGDEVDVEAGRRDEGGDLGGAKVTPVRTVEAGVFRFETWIEEGKAKFEMGHAPKSSFGSSVGET